MIQFNIKIRRTYTVYFCSSLLNSFIFYDLFYFSFNLFLHIFLSAPQWFFQVCRMFINFLLCSFFYNWLTKENINELMKEKQSWINELIVSTWRASNIIMWWWSELIFGQLRFLCIIRKFEAKNFFFKCWW